ncbi:MAG: GspH/FimT family pseudopilin [Deltaproteobacteria bacterium]|nr:GspH/FimT family pseudopilin [Deltaproteobacteria bacterium]
MMRDLRKLKGQGGLTMIEIIAVLLIIGIITAIAISRMSNRSDYDLPSQVEVIKNHLRYAQTRAMNTDTVWGITFDSQTTYYLFQGAGNTTPVPIPGENATKVNLTVKKSSLKITSNTPQTITFNAYGSPGSTTLTVGTTGGSITVTKNTGFIP